MTRDKLYIYEPKEIRDMMNAATDQAEVVQKEERKLVEMLVPINQKRYFVRYGFKTLRGFVVQGMKFSRIQAQRIGTNVRRYEPPSSPPVSTNKAVSMRKKLAETLWLED